jgi:hypothetical protein
LVYSEWDLRLIAEVADGAKIASTSGPSNTLLVGNAHDGITVHAVNGWSFYHDCYLSLDGGIIVSSGDATDVYPAIFVQRLRWYPTERRLKIMLGAGGRWYNKYSTLSAHLDFSDTTGSGCYLYLDGLIASIKTTKVTICPNAPLVVRIFSDASNRNPILTELDLSLVASWGTNAMLRASACDELTTIRMPKTFVGLILGVGECVFHSNTKLSNIVWTTATASGFPVLLTGATKFSQTWNDNGAGFPSTDFINRMFKEVIATAGGAPTACVINLGGTTTDIEITSDSPAYSNLVDYVVGNWVMVDGEAVGLGLYRCIQPNGPGSATKDPTGDGQGTYWELASDTDSLALMISDAYDTKPFLRCRYLHKILGWTVTVNAGDVT